ncbi:hypothetical protein GWI33_020167 [Rhynchophorus ferrugineus]|uniref:Uncharacterized protein n=1 Tax=Rhynchophorus ferrugineus TaxID=354439 RepID=A0A834HR19_RHYFE|nr:hypothetical protein GWI33_020167 [Rhynchophorus ferrugineus]
MIQEEIGFKVPCNHENDQLPLVEIAQTRQRVQKKFNSQETELEDFITFDDDLTIRGELSDAEIITSVLLAVDEEAKEDEEDECKIN